MQGKISIGPDAAQAAETSQMADAEAQMRRALGLFGAGSRSKPEGGDRQDTTPRMGDRFNPAAHRRRFVQDGDIPVTVVRRDNSADAAAGPSSSRLQRVETALTAETAARQHAERALADAMNQNRELQTKCGHAELIRAEATEALKREREESTALRAAAAEQAGQLQNAEERAAAAEEAQEQSRASLHEERSVRKSAERALRDAVAAREQAEELLAEQQENEAAIPALLAPHPVITVKTTSNRPVIERRLRPVLAQAPAAALEPEPVKWWLSPTPAAKRR